MSRSDWHIWAGNEEKIVAHCLTQDVFPIFLLYTPRFLIVQIFDPLSAERPKLQRPNGLTNLLSLPEQTRPISCPLVYWCI